MHSAVLYIKDQKELELSKIRLFDKPLINYTVDTIKKLNVDDIYLVGDINIDGLLKRNNLEEVFGELKYSEGKCLLLSPFYPLLEKEDYERLLNVDNNAVFVDENKEILPIFAISNALLSSYDKLSYDGIKINRDKQKRLDELKDIPYFYERIKERSNNKWMNKGVIIVDPKTTMIGVDAYIGKGTYINPNTTIGGKSFIGSNNIINQSNLENVVMGDNNNIDSAKISNSSIFSNCQIGSETIIDNCDIQDEVNIASFVRISNTKVDRKTTINHLSFISDAIIGENVLIGTGVNTINYDGRSKHNTVIKSNTTIGSNVNIIAPIIIGEYAMVSAGSTIDVDVKDGDLAIARIFQQNKKGYGYKYNKED